MENLNREQKVGEKTANREQTRRDDVTEMARNLVESQRMAADTTERIIDAMLIQLEQAERELDEARADLDQAQQHITALGEDIAFTARTLDEQLTATNAAEDERLAALQVRLAPVPALVEALRLIEERCSARDGTTVVRDQAAIIAREALARYEQSLGNG